MRADPVDLTIGAPSPPEVEPNNDDALYGDEMLIDDDGELVNAPQVDESIVRTALRSVAGVASYTLGRDDVDEHWQFTARELDDLTPPLTRIINRRPQLRAAVARGDEAAVAIVLASYTGRNVASGRRARIEQEKAKNAELQRQADQSSPASGAAADGGIAEPSGHGGGNPYGFPTPAGGAMG